VLGLMIWSGILIYWANDVYPGFFPEAFYKAFRINHRLAEGMAIHFTLGWILVFIGFSYLSMMFLSGHWRELFPDRNAVRKLIPTLLAEVGLRPHLHHDGKFNPAQRFAYTGFILLAILEVLSGFALYKPVQLRWIATMLGGHEAVHAIHFACMIAIVLFFFVHVIQVARAGWNNFRSMVAGFEVKE
jgi:thiosulfate reductase cytochrome b subunit